jgi:hypothetical protein
VEKKGRTCPFRIRSYPAEGTFGENIVPSSMQ